MVQFFIQVIALPNRVRTKWIGQQWKVLQEKLVGFQSIQQNFQILQMVFIQTGMKSQNDDKTFIVVLYGWRIFCLNVNWHLWEWYSKRLVWTKTVITLEN